MEADGGSVQVRYNILDPLGLVQILTSFQGKVKAGVSNWSLPYLEHLEKSWKVVPAVNQVRAESFS